MCVSQFSLPGEETLSFSCIMGDAASVTVCLFVNVVCVNNLCVYACLCACDILFVCVVHILCGSGGYNGSAWARKKRESDGQQTSSVSVCERLQRARIYAVLITSLQSGTAYILQKKKKKIQNGTHTQTNTHIDTHTSFFHKSKRARVRQERERETHPFIFHMSIYSDSWWRRVEQHGREGTLR